MQKQSNSDISLSAKRLRRMDGLMRPTGKLGLEMDAKINPFLTHKAHKSYTKENQA